jgi:iron complex transport system substrate-binding protein
MTDAKRIVSLVPSLTKTISDFHLDHQIVGITKFCVDPPSLWRSAQQVGGTKDPNVDLVFSLNPTHVLVNLEENRVEDIEILERNLNILKTFPKSPQDVPGMLADLGAFLDCPKLGLDHADVCRFRLDQASQLRADSSQARKKFIYLIWRDPWMAVGHDTYISRFLEIFGLQNMIVSRERYPVIDPRDFDHKSLDIVFMSSEPWPFRKRDAQSYAQIIGSDCPDVYWIDGKAMSWYGTETVPALDLWLKGTPPIKQLL